MSEWRSMCTTRQRIDYFTRLHSPLPGLAGVRQRIFNMDHLSGALQASMVENRLEQGTQAGLAVQVPGRDCNGTPFTQRVIANNVSRSGALLSGLSRGMRSGDLLWVEYEQRKKLDRRAPHGTQ
jgi:hypothetical protein